MDTDADFGVMLKFQIRSAGVPQAGQLRLYQVDAFTKHLFKGNPAAVVPLDQWLSDQQLQSIAGENNLSETAFILPGSGDESFQIRWFTPTQEVDLCGHATLASAHVLFDHLGHAGDEILFTSKGGKLQVRKERGYLWLDFPVLLPSPVENAEQSQAVRNALGLNGDAEVFESPYDFLVKVRILSRHLTIVVSSKAEPMQNEENLLSTAGIGTQFVLQQTE